MIASFAKSNKVLVFFSTAIMPTSGITRVILNYYEEIKGKYKIDFAGFTDIDKDTDCYLTGNNIQYHRLPDRVRHPLSYVWNLYKVCKSYDVVHVNGNSPTMLVDLLPAMLAGVKIRIAHCHTSVTSHPIISKLMMPLFKHSYTTAVACSDKAGDWIFGSGNYIFLPNAIKPENYRFDDRLRRTVREKLNLQDEILLGHVGRFSPEKNHGFLLEIFEKFHALHPKSALILIGSGAGQEAVKSQVRARGLESSVIFTGAVSNVKDYLCAVDVFVFPSIFEGLPLSVVEAQAMGIDCVISDSITREVKLSEHCHFLPLSKGADCWAREIDSECARLSRSKEANDAIAESMFNIHNSALKLEEIYDGTLA